MLLPKAEGALLHTSGQNRFQFLALYFTRSWNKFIVRIYFPGNAMFFVYFIFLEKEILHAFHDTNNMQSCRKRICSPFCSFKSLWNLIFIFKDEFTNTIVPISRHFCYSFDFNKSLLKLTKFIITMRINLISVSLYLF